MDISGKMTRSACCDLARPRKSRCRARFPAMSPTTGLICASAIRIGLFYGCGDLASNPPGLLKQFEKRIDVNGLGHGHAPGNLLLNLGQAVVGGDEYDFQIGQSASKLQSQLGSLHFRQSDIEEGDI